MDKVLKIISKLVSPGKTWGEFLRKSLSAILVAALGIQGFNLYERHEYSHWEDLPLHTAITKGNISERVQQYLEDLKRSDPGIKSIWLYSWPDARSLIPVAHAGSHINPLPIGYLLRTDSKVVGELVFSACDCLNRTGKKLLACPIMTENDAWGIIVFEHELDTKRPSGYKSIYAALAHKLSYIIYHNYHD